MSDLSFSVVLTAVTTAFNQAIERARSQYKQFGDTVGQESDRSKGKSEEAAKAIYGLLNIKTGGTLKTEIAQISKELATFQARSGAPAKEVERVTKAAQARIQELRRELGEVRQPADNALQSITNIGKGALALTGLTVGLGAIKSGIDAVVAASIKFDQINKQLEFATGSTTRAAEEFEFAKRTALALGLELTSAAGSYAKLAAATKGTALEGEGTRKVFEGVASAAASLGLSADDTSGVLLALSQMASKGKVSMEELRGQLGERLPGAMAIAARSMGVTEAELNKLIEAGIDSTTFLKAFGPAMIEAFGPTAAKNAQTLQGTINNLKNEFNLFLNDLGKGGVGDAVASVLRDISAALGALKTSMNSMDPAAVDAVKAAFTNLYGIVLTVFQTLMTAVTEAGNVLDTVVGVVGDLTGAFTGLDSSTEKVSFLTRTVQGLSIVMGLIRDGVAAIGIGFTVTTGLVQSFFASIANGLSKVTFGDLSRQLAEVSQTLREDAAASFGRAEQAAMGFQSAAVAALDRTTEAANRAGAGVGAGLTSGSATAAAAVESVAARGGQSMEQLRQSATQAGQAMGTAGESAQASFRQAELAAQNAGVTVTTAAGQVLTATRGMSQLGQEVAEAFRDIGKEVGINIPPSAKAVGDLGLILGAAAAQTDRLAQDVGKTLPEALGKLNGDQVREFQVAFVGGLERAGASTRTIQQALLDLGTIAAKTLGVDMARAMTTTTREFDVARRTVEGFIADFDNLADRGVDANVLITNSLQAMLNKARNPAELRELIRIFEQLGESGKISGREMAEGVQAAKDKIDQLLPGVNSLAEAFKVFGLKSREEAAITAARYEEAFRLMKESGQASIGDLRTAFARYAQEAVAANKGVVDAKIAAQAASLGLKIQVDETGRVIVESMGKAQEATDRYTRGLRDGEEAIKKMIDFYDRLMLKQTLSADLNANQIRMLEEEAAHREKLLDLELRRLNVDKEKFTLDSSGNRLSAGGQTYMSIANQLKGFGLDDTAATRIAREFTDHQGNVPYFSNPGQLKYGQRNEFGGTYDTLDMAVQRAATQYLLGQNAPRVGGPAGGGSRQVIEFKGPGGVSATVATTQGSTVEGVMAVLRGAGAVASVR